MKINFTKANASGNDFVIMDNRDLGINEGIYDFVKLLCHRRFAIGADGLILVEKNESGEFVMKYYNSDGSLGSLCGNGSRCTAKYIYEKIEKKDIISFEAVGKNYSAIINPDSVKLFLPDLDVNHFEHTLRLDGDLIPAYFIDTGSPHAVIFVEDWKSQSKLNDIDVYMYGKEIRHMKEFQPYGTNVNFVEFSKDNIVSIRTFERGVEDETLACGTGSIASALLSNLIKLYKTPIKIHTHGGDIFTVGFNINGSTASNLFLEGCANLVYSGIIDYDFNQKKII